MKMAPKKMTNDLKNQRRISSYFLKSPKKIRGSNSAVNIPQSPELNDDDASVVVSPTPQSSKGKKVAKKFCGVKCRPLLRLRNDKASIKRKLTSKTGFSPDCKKHTSPSKHPECKRNGQTKLKDFLSPEKLKENKINREISRNLFGSCDDEAEFLKIVNEAENDVDDVSREISEDSSFRLKRKQNDLDSIIVDDSLVNCLEGESDLDLTASTLNDLEAIKISCDGPKTAASDLRPVDKFQRFKVSDVIKSDGIELSLQSERDNQVRVCTLRGFWIDTVVKQGDIVHIDAEFVDNNSVIDNECGSIVVNPDFLVSGTSVVSTLFCMRKSVLNEKFKGCDPGNVHMLHGTLVHQLFQQVLKRKITERDAIRGVLKEVIHCNKSLHDIYAHGQNEKEVEKEMTKFVPMIQTWISQYFESTSRNVVKERELCIDGVVDIEENYWCPRYGIKGKVDLTVKLRQKNASKSKIVPMELKTGRPTFSAEHQGQVTLYQMMMEDRYGQTSDGLLLYLRDGVKMKLLSSSHDCRRGLVQLRNELANNLIVSVDKKKSDDEVTYHLSKLPEPINDKRLCSKCPQLLNCSLYRRKVDKVPIDNNYSVMNELADDALKHLCDSHLEFFHHWCLLLHLESEYERKRSLRNKIWLSPAWDREEKGECFSNMFLHATTKRIADDQYLHVFRRRGHPNNLKLTDVGLNVTDTCIVSNQQNLEIALSSGFIYDISLTEVQVILDRDLRDGSNAGNKVYRIDKNDSYSTFTINATNLSLLLAKENSELRSRVVDKSPPVFRSTLNKDIVVKGKSILKTLNKPQQKAIFKTLMCDDYVLIKGMPGTGKTSTIVALIRILLLVGQRVLVTSYTHSAVDNILLRLKSAGCRDFIRLGKVSRTHPEIRPFSADILTEKIRTVDELAEFYNSKAVVATTCLGTNHPLFRHRKFDICIVDEASQVLLPACLGPLFHASKFVLVGDSQQLPPVVQNEVARNLGMTESLFSHLEAAESTADLHLQYRMNGEITRISNELTYGGLLKCATRHVHDSTLDIRVDDASDDLPLWLSTALDVDLTKSVVFVDTDEAPSLLQRKDPQGFTYNPGEADVVVKICSKLIQVGLDERVVGVITPYRRQVIHIRKSLSANSLDDVEVNTVDQYQGREKSVVVMSCVRTDRSDDNRSVDILQDARRLNVAVTRAKHKLIIIGSRSTMRSYEPLKELLLVLTAEQIVSLTPRNNSF